MTGEENHLIAASRTDSGVHALGQVAHFKTRTLIPPVGFMRGINSMVKKDISVIDAQEAQPDFHAQKDAKWKHYRYLISNSETHSALLLNRCWQIKEKLDIQAMRIAAKYLQGRHDFASFQSKGSSAKDAVRRIKKINVSTHYHYFVSLWPFTNNSIIAIDIIGDGFVYHMVRNIVGTLVLIGKRRVRPEYMKEVLIKKERKLAGVCAPASGLYLVCVKY